MLGRTESDYSRVPAEALISSVHGYLYQAPADPDTLSTSNIYIYFNNILLWKLAHLQVFLWTTLLAPGVGGRSKTDNMNTHTQS